MPELPEVETVCNGLKDTILNKKILFVEVRRPDLRWPIPKDLNLKVKNTEVISIKRRSKFLLIELSSDLTILLHLGMSGRIILVKEKTQTTEILKKKESNTYNHNRIPQKHDHLIFHFEKNRKIFYNDTRRFGAIDLVETHLLNKHKWLKYLGPEPLEEDFSLEYLQKILRKKSLNIKSAIMDQKIISGIGNIYACEALWKAEISPFYPAKKLNKKKLINLIYSIKVVLKQAILSGGSSLKDFTNISGEIGYFQNKFNVYSRENLDCNKKGCVDKIKKLNISGRSTFFCPSCQKNNL